MFEHTNAIEKDGLKIAYGLSGNNDLSVKHTLVFIHGNTASKDAFVHQIEALSEQYQVLAIDLPGHGQSGNATDPLRQYTISEYAKSCAYVLEQLAISSPVIVGWSLGGHICIEMLAQGFKASGLMITGTPPIAPGLSDIPSAFLQNEVMALTGKAEFTDEDAQLYLSALYGECISPSLVAAAQRTDPQARNAMTANWAQGDDGADQKAFVATWNKPIAIVHGHDEQFVNLSYLEALPIRTLFEGRIYIVNDAGHAVFLQQPSVFNQYLSNFAAHCFGSSND
ncbi:alpha/beta fold hydrolase [Ningiella sp. W23]|uniref:alpha/beta fold hydrolase n=1 Tax=Ningiella sp. W23 TaxID=3023715 RepID=UPI0037576AD7